MKKMDKNLLVVNTSFSMTLMSLDVIKLVENNISGKFGLTNLSSGAH